MSSDSETLPPPNDPEAFESLCLELWKHIWGDLDAQKNGRDGQSQAGVDIYGQHLGKWMGVQCKQKGGLLHTRVTIQDLEAEVQKARRFSPPLASFVLATSGPPDVQVQQRARELTDLHQRNDFFTVYVWSWREIWQELYGRPEVLETIGPVFWPRLWQVVGKQVAAAALAAKPFEFYSCFISYSTKDEEFAQRLHVNLQANGVRCWIAPEDLKIGDKFRVAIDETIRVYDKLLLVLSEHSIRSDWVEKEVESALEKESEQKRNMLFPIRLDDALMDIKTGLVNDNY